MPAIAALAVLIVTVGPKVISLAAPKGEVIGTPVADNAPWRKHYAEESDFFAAMSRYSEAESERARMFCEMVRERKYSNGLDKPATHKVIVVVSTSASEHNPKDKVYSKIAGVDDLLVGLEYVEDQRIVTK
jgi:hypothetical protein